MDRRDAICPYPQISVVRTQADDLDITLWLCTYHGHGSAPFEPCERACIVNERNIEVMRRDRYATLSPSLTNVKLLL